MKVIIYIYIYIVIKERSAGCKKVLKEKRSNYIVEIKENEYPGEMNYLDVDIEYSTLESTEEDIEEYLEERDHLIFNTKINILEIIESSSTRKNKEYLLTYEELVPKCSCMVGQVSSLKVILQILERSQIETMERYYKLSVESPSSLIMIGKRELIFRASRNKYNYNFQFKVIPVLGGAIDYPLLNLYKNISEGEGESTLGGRLSFGGGVGGRPISWVKVADCQITSIGAGQKLYVLPVSLAHGRSTIIYTS